MELSKNEINYNFFRYYETFEKCIEISDDSVAIFSPSIIYIYKKNKEEKSDYSFVKSIGTTIKIYDVIAVNNNCLACCGGSEQKKIIFYDNNLIQKKILSTKDYIKSKNALFLFNKFIVVKCEKGISLILIKTKEVVQYIEIPEYEDICVNNEFIYSFVIETECNEENDSEEDNRTNKYHLSISKMKIIDNALEIVENFNKIGITNDKYKFLCLKEEKFAFTDEKLYKVKLYF